MRIGSGIRLVFALAIAASPATAADLALDLPVVCRPGVDCWVVNYVDLDAGPGVRDFNCGQASYNGHKGVDIAVRDFAQVRAGIPARATAAGTVARVRDGIDDRAAAPKGQECGNGVVVDHGGGWTTQYCHLRRGSIAVKPGAPIAAGDAIGMIGQSGLADFPHVHVQVALNGTIVDPFRGVDGDPKACGLGRNHLWSPGALALLASYRPTAVYSGGIVPEEPQPAKARGGDYDGGALSIAAPALVVWADIFWVRGGDRIRVRLLDPAGAVLTDRTVAIEKTQARRFIYAGIRRKESAWPAGVYKAEIAVLREKDGRLEEESRLTRPVEVR